MLICGGGLRADENWMSAETSWVHDVAGGQKDMVGDRRSVCKALKVMVESLNCICHSI